MSDPASKEDKAASLDQRAKSLRPLPIVVEPPALVPARMVNEVHYCERLMYLEWSQGEFAHNAFTVDGQAVHKRANIASGTLPSPSPHTSAEQASGREGNDELKPLGPGMTSDDLADDEEMTPYVAKSLWLSSEKLGLTAKTDVVEGDSGGSVVPIEYKRSAAPDVPEGAFLPERAQVCAQVLLLREHGYTCDHAEIYFARSRRRVRIVIDEALVQMTLGSIHRIRELTSRGIIPPPLVDSPKCDGCSLVGICLPDETNLLNGLELAPATTRDAPPSDADPAAAFWPVANDDDSEAEEVVLRKLHPARDDRLPLYVQDQGAKISLSGEELVIKTREGGTRNARMPNLSHVSLFGNVQITTQALRACMERGLPVSLLSTGGWFYGRATASSSKNIELRVAQHRAFQDSATCVRLANGIVASKIRNSRTLLRRNHDAAPEVTLFELEQLAKKAERCETLTSLLGIEGTAARSYFGAFSGMLKGAWVRAFEMDGRNRRPPRDPINALLSLVYSLLTTELTNAISGAGLDVMLGFFHQPRFGRPALALDLMEEFRPIVGDSTVIAVINNGVVSPSDFVVHPTGVALKSFARKRVIEAYERRLDQLVTHPVFGYRISYRRVLEVQARLLGRFLLGEINSYPEFRTR